MLTFLSREKVTETTINNLEQAGIIRNSERAMARLRLEELYHEDLLVALIESHQQCEDCKACVTGEISKN